MKNCVVVFILLLVVSSNIFSQGLTIGSGTTFTGGSAIITISGNWSNSGTFAAGASTVNFYSNGNQTITNISGETFNNLTVNKSSDDVLLNNNISVSGTLTLTAGDIDLNGKVITLGSSGTLNESSGNTVKGTSGSITATRILNAPEGINIAGLGAVIRSAVDLGSTVVTRGHAAQSGGGNSGILRYYDISPTNNSGLNATLTYYYDESELNNISENSLCLFRSTDNGQSWSSEGGDCETAENLIELSGIDAFSRWTAGGDAGPLPVELVSFIANIEGEFINIIWETATEVNNYGFEVERAIYNEQSTIDNWETIGFVPGHGNSNSLKRYEFVDVNHFGENRLNLGVYVDTLIYRLKQIDTDGTTTYYDSVLEVDVSSLITSIREFAIPEEYELSQNYPNPFNPTTTIRYHLPEANNVKLKIYDALGAEVITLVDEYKSAGRYKVKLNAGTLSSGLYIYKLVAGDFTSIKKMILLK